MNRVIQDTGSKYPIIQAPMGWIARSQLASAVCEAGGMGIIETSSGEVDNCKKEIQLMSELTDKPFGVNLPLLFLQDDSMVKFCVDAGVKFVTTSAGDPTKYVGILKDAGITVYHAVPSLAGAIKAADAGGIKLQTDEGITRINIKDNGDIDLSSDSRLGYDTQYDYYLSGNNQNETYIREAMWTGYLYNYGTTYKVFRDDYIDFVLVWNTNTFGDQDYVYPGLVLWATAQVIGYGC